MNATLKAIKNIPKKNGFKFNNLDPSESNAPFRIINVGNSKSINLLTCIKIIENIIGKKAIKKFMPIQKGDILKTNSDLKKIKRILKYKTETRIEDGLTKFINWFKIYHKLN